MLVLGLTGNIGCGKSSLSKIFEEKGIAIIDADIISRKILEDRETLNEVYKEFGEDIKNNNGELNRKKLASIVFNDDNQLKKLNNITHPRIKNNIYSKIQSYKNDKNTLVVVDAALLIEAEYLDIINKLLVVTCKKDVQIERIVKRDSCSEDEAMSRISAQMEQNEKVKYADYTIDNSGSKEELYEKALKFLLYVKEHWCD